MQSDVFVCRDGADLASRLSVSSREIPLPTPANDAPMFVKLFVAFGC
jgi:hypothetical protein